MTDSIIKTIEIAAPVEKVWDALIDHEKFGAWFRVALDQPFAVGQASTGHMTYPGYEHYRWETRIVAIEPMTRFAYEWPATGGDKALMESGVPVPEWTLIEFVLEPVGNGTRLTVTESGFDKVPEPRRSNVMRSNDGGWAEQVKNIRDYVRVEDSPAAGPARLFAALGDATRLGLIGRLSEGGERSIVQLGDGLPISRQAVAKHLDVLLGAGLVRRTKSGREVLFTLRPEVFAEARDWLDQVGSQWDGTLGRFKDFVENQP